MSGSTGLRAVSEELVRRARDGEREALREITTLAYPTVRRRLASLLQAFFEKLPARQREVFDLADLQGFTSPEIAAMLGIEPVCVRAHLFKARRTLRKRILSADPDLVENMR